MAFKDLTGQKFNKLTALYPTDERSSGKNIIWVCQCDCGKLTKANSGQLQNGKKKSCGCWVIERMSNLNRSHGGRHERLYLVWMDMRRRCYDPKEMGYKNYGGRGIKVCDEWHDYSEFRKWALEHGYDENAARGECTLDRIDVNGDYCPENCRWTNMKAQCSNKRNNRYLTYCSETKTVKQWIETLGLRGSTVYNRLKVGFLPSAVLYKGRLSQKAYDLQRQIQEINNAISHKKENANARNPQAERQ